VFTVIFDYVMQTRGMSEKAPFKDFDLTVKHVDERHYVPPKARRPEEIERRRRMPRGSVLVEQQQRGIAMASAILNHVQEESDIAFAKRVLTASGINTAWYNFAQDAPDVMRRRLKLPPVAVEDDPWRADQATLLGSARYRYEDAVLLADRVVAATELRSRRLPTHKKILGRHLGETSLVLACVDMDASAIYGTAFDVQHVVRQRSLAALEDARIFANEIGVHPTLAQLADPDSDLSVYWRRNATAGAYDAYEQATSLQPIAA
jgi:hypothetical protein